MTPLAWFSVGCWVVVGLCLLYMLFLHTYYPLKWKIQDWWWARERKD